MVAYQRYHGHNCYALLLSKYGTAKLVSGGQVPTFDLVDIQLYVSALRGLLHNGVLHGGALHSGGGSRFF